MTHLYRSSFHLHSKGAHQAVLETACGLRKPWDGGKLPPEVTESAGAVTCPECVQKAQQGKKAQ